MKLTALLLAVLITVTAQGQAWGASMIEIGGRALTIVGQPAGNPVYVDSRPGTVTHFGAADRFGSTGLLAHNYLAGRLFFGLGIGDEVRYNGATYVVAEIVRYRALDPYNPAGNLQDLETDEILSPWQVAERVYGTPGALVLQTCISQDGNPSWGRLFVIALPA